MIDKYYILNLKTNIILNKVFFSYQEAYEYLYNKFKGKIKGRFKTIDRKIHDNYLILNFDKKTHFTLDI